MNFDSAGLGPKVFVPWVRRYDVVPKLFNPLSSVSLGHLQLYCTRFCGTFLNHEKAKANGVMC
jgi:hypothetical protein